MRGLAVIPHGHEHIPNEQNLFQQGSRGLCFWNGVDEFHTTIFEQYDGEEGSFLGRSFAYDCIVLDYILPKKDGAKVLREIRDSGRTTPIIFLSVNDETVSKVFALENGADDYLAKPFSLDELRARRARY
jgi:DNA-binding response OmpR family regulator